MKRLFLLFLSVIIILNITTCNKKPREIVIGLNYEGSGTLSPYGRAMLDGVRLAVEEINASGGIDGHTVRLEKADNRSVGAESAAAVLYLSSVKKADVIIGPATSTLAKAALAANADVLIISPSATADSLTQSVTSFAEGNITSSGCENIVCAATSFPIACANTAPLVVSDRSLTFRSQPIDDGAKDRPLSLSALPSSQGEGLFLRICFSDSVQGSAMGRYAEDQGFTKAAVLVDMSSDYSVGCAKAFRENFSGEIVFEGRFFSGDTDFSALVTQLAQTGADCVYLPAYYTEAGLIIRQSREQGIDATFLGGDAMDSPYLVDVIGKKEYVRDIIYTDHFTPDDERYEEFAQKYFDRYGENPPAYAALAYDSVMLYCEALRETGVENIHNVETTIFNTQSFQGVTGEITIKENGDCDKQPVFVSPTVD